MATVNLGAIKFNWKGAYAGGTAYVADDVVSYLGSSYVCILASTGNVPTNGTYWNQMSSAGTNGTNGTNGTDVGTVITTQGDILYRDGSGLQRLAKGTAGQALLMNSGANAPEWGAGGEKNTPVFDARANASQTVSNNTNTKITFGLENVDSDGCFANSRFTPTTAGWYHFIGSTGGTSKSGYIAVWVKKNNNEDYYIVDSSSHVSSYFEGGSKVLYMDGSSDYVELYINMANGRTLSHNSTNAATRFSGFRIIT